MKDDVFKRIEDKEKRSLFKDERIFNVDYRPQSLEEVLHRDSQIEKIVETVAKPTRGIRAELYVYGVSGVGKTYTVRAVLDTVPKEWLEKFQWALVNCKTIQPFSGYQVFKYISERLGAKWGKVGTGFSTKKVTDWVVRAHERKPLLVVLDEADVMANEKKFEFLYTFFNAKISLILISNVFNWTDKTDMRIQSRSRTERIVFVDYTKDEMRDILEFVAEKGLKKDVISGGIMEKITDYTIDVLAGDVRKGKYLMSGCVYEAMEEGAGTVTEEHFAKALDKIKPMSLKDMLKIFSRIVQLVLAGYVAQRINTNSSLGGGEYGGRMHAQATTKNIYHFYKIVAKLNGANPVGETMMQNHLQRVEASGILTHDTIHYKEKRGKTNVYYSENYETKDIGQVLWDSGIKFPLRGTTEDGFLGKHDLFE